MATFVEGIRFETYTCSACGIPFALTADFVQRRRNDKATWYCPAGHGQVFRGNTEAQKLQAQLDATTRQLENARANVDRVRHERDAVAKAHRKMRVRVMNGVCPCCNRSFENLRRHMHDQHPDFGQPQTLRVLREAFGMTQGQVATEAGVHASYVSLYERGKPVPVEARDNLEWWLDRQSEKRA